MSCSSHQGMLNSVAWSPDGQFIASAGQDSVVRVWNAITGQTVFDYVEHTSSVNAIAWSPYGQFIASASQDRTIRVWKPGRSKMYLGHTSDVLAVAWSPDGTYIASGSLPTVANGVVYIGSMDHNLYAFRADGCGKEACPPLW